MLDDVSASVMQIDEPIKSLLVDSELVGSCNGLVCMFKKRSKMYHLFIMNPTTKKSRKVVMYGFGYDDYKVVKIAECRSGLYGILVYSLKTNAWIEVRNRTNFLFSSRRGIFASGSLHEISTNCTEIIVAFDLGLQQFKEVPLLCEK
ncbi:hypothetical protein POM88_013990 [Heracleum sosnowskyi]|uniref:F-box associated beta-propeller type 3 domain-containing protein n=1 Tax=Heracleum sosnowskyi TaxID=360622 RepID=A0AAD8J163_9APIA|nr:hypothetical protein POM88_013990 [Heracleum sosnowskyi]